MSIELSGLLSFVFNICIALLVYKSDSQRRLCRYFALCSSCIALWSVGSSTSNLISNEHLALQALKVSYLFGCFFPFVFLLFTHELIHCDLHYKKYLQVAALACSTLLGLTLPLNVFIQGFDYIDTYRISSPGIVYYAFFAFFLIVCTYCLAQMILTLTHRPNAGKNRVGYITLAYLVAVFGGLEYFLTVFGIFHRAPSDDYYLVVSVTLMAYAIVRHNILSFKQIVQNTIYYTVLTTVITAIYFGSVYLLHNVINENLAGAYHVNSLVALMFIVIAFRPLEICIRKYLDKRFFKGTIDQISSQKEYLESELERTHRLKSVGILAAGMAHEIRNPIQSLRTFGEHLEKSYDDPQFRAKFQKLLLQETERIKHLTSDLLDFSKPKEPKKVKTDLNELINQTLSLVESDLMAEGIKVQKQLPDQPIYKELDPEQIKQALLNLILNAKDAMKHSKEKVLTIALDRESQSQKIGVRLQFSEKHENQRLAPIFITIKDTGCGIPEDRIPHLFDPFYTDKKEGTGLGLAITHSIIERHGGRIEVGSQAKGVSFRIILT